MHAAGFRGEGMHIAVLDAGFPGVNVIPAFQPLFQQNRLLSTFDVVRGGTSVYDIDSHGTWVLSTMAAYQPNAFIGTAPNASYHLIRTEDNRGTESPVEEAYWLIGAEYADSVGVDIINSSLGYRDFDNPDFSYSYSQMDGNTALSTRAADLASAVGILVVNSAGNSGNNAAWPYVSAPADGDSVLSVGAVDSLGVRIGFSSVGPTADGQIKPNLATQGSQTAIIDPSGFIGRGSGTSFASPVLAGMAAGFWQANPTLTAQQVRQYLELSGSQASAPDNLLGYGIPDFRRAYNLANPNSPLGLPVGEGRSVLELYPNPVPGAAFALRLPARLINQLLTVRITDAVGRTVSEQQLKTPSGSDSVTITAGENVLKSGLYLCQVRAASGEQHTLRFVRN